MKFIFILLVTLFSSILLASPLKDNIALKKLEGRWKLLESNYYLDGKLLDYKGNMNIIFSISIEENIMKWVSDSGTVKTFFFDFETGKKNVTTKEYRDNIESSITDTKKLIHSVLRKYTGNTKTLNVRNSFELKNDGKTMHHIFEDFNGKKIYKVYSIYGRDAKSISGK